MVSSLSVVHWTANELRILCLWNRNWVGPAYSLRLIHISSYNWLAIIDSLTVWTPASVREENRAQWVDHALLYMLTSWHVRDYWPFVRGIHQVFFNRGTCDFQKNLFFISFCFSNLTNFESSNSCGSVRQTYAISLYDWNEKIYKYISC